MRTWSGTGRRITRLRRSFLSDPNLSRCISTRTAWCGSRVALDSVVAAFRLGETAEGIVESYPTLRLADVYQILGYYLLHRDAVDTYVNRREREAGRLREEIEADFAPTGLRARLLARRADER